LFDRPGPSGGVCQTSRDFAGTYRFVDTGGTMSSGSASVIAPGDYRATTTADAVVTLDANAPGGFKGLAAAGVWTVTVTDMGTIDTGKVTGVRLELR
ncbi:MAG: hypothetical protein U0169_05050, partial [Polyangiaceae bacterium]